MLEVASASLEKVFQTMLEYVKSSGEAVLADLVPSASQVERQEVLNKVWKNTLSEALKKSDANSISIDEWLTQGVHGAPVPTTPNPPRRTLTKKELLALADEDKNESYYTERAEQSKLYKCGYSVSKDNGMSATQRQNLLEHLIQTQQVSKGYVIRFLEHLIKINGQIETNNCAVAKWKADLAFVRNMK